AELRVGLKMNVAGEDLAAVVAELPALKRPTVSSLANGDWVAVETIVESALVRDLIPRLKAAGAQGIIEYPLNKMIM
ncbi:MAG: ATP phosphoribosyltransferase, partial [Armatimonadetes bacterium]|nr:ATP phosphoribosyltransferase [Armatimonadota bacterium]